MVIRQGEGGGSRRGKLNRIVIACNLRGECAYVRMCVCARMRCCGNWREIAVEVHGRCLTSEYYSADVTSREQGTRAGAVVKLRHKRPVLRRTRYKTSLAANRVDSRSTGPRTLHPAPCLMMRKIYARIRTSNLLTNLLYHEAPTHQHTNTNTQSRNEDTQSRNNDTTIARNVAIPHQKRRKVRFGD